MKFHIFNVLIATLGTIGTLVYGQKWPILLFEEDESGVIPCIAQGKASAFFWKRGDWFNISKEIAYYINGVSNSHMKNFHVYSNGSLLIKHMAVADEGSYHCRVVSDHTECRGSVTVHLKVSTNNSSPYIDGCGPNTGCTIYEKPSAITFLTCKATKVTPDMLLKWFKDSKEITDSATKSEDKNAMNETIISSTISIQYKEPQFLTCQASSMKMETAFAHVQLQSEPVHRTSAGIIVVTVVLGAAGAVLLGFVLYTFVKRNQNKKEKLEAKKKQLGKERAEGESTPLHNNKKLDEVTIELEQVKKDFSNETERTQVLIETNNRELDRLKGELSDEQKRTRDLGEKLSAESTKRSMEEKMKEEIKEKLQRTETELKKLEILQVKQTAMNDQGNGEGKKLNDLLDTLMRQIGENEQKLQDSKVELESMREKLQKAEKESRSLSKKLQLSNQDLQTAKDSVTSLTSQLQAKDNEIELSNQELQKAKHAVKSLISQLQEKDNELESHINKIKAMDHELKNLSGSHELFQRQLRSKVLEGKDNYTTFCRIKTAKRKTDSFINRKDEVTLKTTKSEYKYSFIFPLNATREDVFSRLEDLVQNAIDGGKSAILVHGNCPEHNLYIMYGTGNDVDEGIVLKTIRKIFHITKTWTRSGYAAEINAIFAKIFPGRESQFTFSPVEGPPMANTKYNFTNDDLEVKGLEVSVATEDTAIGFLKKYTEKLERHDQKQVFTNDFVQFYITTKFKSDEISTGTLTFVLYNNVEALKDCFTDNNEKPLFPRYFSSMINAEGSKVRILSNIDEDKKEEAKEHLKFSNWINEKPLISRWKKMIGLVS